MSNKEDTKEEILTQIGLSKKNRELYQELYGGTKTPSIINFFYRVFLFSVTSFFLSMSLNVRVLAQVHNSFLNILQSV